MSEQMQPLREVLTAWVADGRTHARWLNTLSYLENCGAKAIAAFEHPTLVRREVLKHAAEEFRHAYYLKSQIPRVYAPGFPDYRRETLLGGYASYHYIHRLNVAVSRFLRQRCSLGGNALKEAAYVLVTYAIECRARSLYALYQSILKEARSSVSVIGIIREEEGHLAEMEEQLQMLPEGAARGEQAVALETELYTKWLEAMRA